MEKYWNRKYDPDRIRDRVAYEDKLARMNRSELMAEYEKQRQIILKACKR